MLAASAENIQIWLTKVFPSLFPFAAACGMLLQIGAAEHIGHLFRPLVKFLFGLDGIAAFPFFSGILSGYPMGAKITAQLYEKRLSECKSCDNLISGVCMKCGCYVEFRAAFKKNNCPNIKDRRW